MVRAQAGMYREVGKQRQFFVTLRVMFVALKNGVVVTTITPPPEFRLR